MKKILLILCLFCTHSYSQLNSNFTVEDSLNCTGKQAKIAFSNTFGGSGNYMYSINLEEDMVIGGNASSTSDWLGHQYITSSGGYFRQIRGINTWYSRYQDIYPIQLGYDQQFQKENPGLTIEADIYQYVHTSDPNFRAMAKVQCVVYDSLNQILGSTEIKLTTTEANLWYKKIGTLDSYERPIHRIRVYLWFKKQSINNPSISGRIDNIKCYFGDLIKDAEIYVKASSGTAHIIDETNSAIKQSYEYVINNLNNPISYLNQLNDTIVCQGDSITQVAGPINTYMNALAFDGIDDWCRVQQAGNKLDSINYSVFFWMKSLNANQVLFSQQGNASNAVRLGLNSGGALQLGNGSTSVNTGTAINDNQWHHVGYTYESATDSVKIYIDGIQSFAGVLNVILTDSMIVIGCLNINGLNTNFFNGRMDEFSLWKKALTPSQINSLKSESVVGHSDLFNNVVFYGFDSHCQLNQVVNFGVYHQGILYNGNTVGDGPQYVSDQLPVFDDSSSFYTIWKDSDGNTVQIGDTLRIVADKPTTYLAEITNGVISFFDSSFVDIYGGFNLGVDRYIYMCDPDDSVLLSGRNGAIHLWNTGSSDSEIYVNESGTYYGHSIENGCFFADTVVLTIQKDDRDSFDLQNFNDQLVCASDSIHFSLDSLPLPSLVMDGIDWIELNSLRDDLHQSDRSFFTWMKTSLSADIMIFGINDSVGGNIAHFGILNGNVRIYEPNTGNITGTADLADGNWHHVGYTYDKNTSLVSVYTDGVLVFDTVVNFGSSSSDWYVLGQELDGPNPSNQFYGELAEVTVWNTALSSAEVLKLYQEAVDSTYASYSNLVGYYRFLDDCAFSETTYDYSHNGNSGIFYEWDSITPGVSIYPNTYIHGYKHKLAYNFQWSTDLSGLISTGTQISLEVRDSMMIYLEYERNNHTWYDTSYIVKLGAYLDLGNDTAFCESDSLTLHAGSGYFYYHWNDSTNDDQLVVDTSGLYYVTVLHQGCTNSDSIQVQVHQVLPLDLGNDTTICDADSFLLTAGSTFQSYDWNSGDTTMYIYPLQTATYAVSVMDNNQCTQLDSVEIIVRKTPKIDLGNDTTYCSSSNITLNAGMGYSTYHWNDSSQHPSLSADISGQYWVTVSDSGCVSSDSISLVIHKISELELGNDTGVCEKLGFKLDAGMAYQMYLWNDSSVGSFVEPQSTGWYKVEVTDSNLCVQNDSIYVEVHSIPIVELGMDSTVCIPDQVILNPFVQANGAPQFEWINQSQSPIFVLNTMLAGLGNHTIWVDITDENGCISRDSVLLTVKNCTVGFDLIESLNSNLKVFPVPADDMLTVKYDLTEKHHVRIELKDIAGRYVLPPKQYNDQNYFEQSIDVSTLSEGTYILQLIVNDSQVVNKKVTIN